MNIRKNTVSHEFRTMFLSSVLVFFLIPGITLTFSQYAVRNLETHLISTVEKNLGNVKNLPETARAEVIHFFREKRLSALCHPSDGGFDVSLKQLCETYAERQSQFDNIHLLALWTLYAGGGVFLLVLMLAGSAFIGRQFQYYSLMSSWWLLMLTAALEAISQGVMLVWLAYWAPAYFMDKIPLQLVLVFAILALMLVVSALAAIFKKPNRFTPVEGLPVNPAHAPVFWNHIRQLADTLQTEPPSQIIAGIDPNFYVTESGVAANGVNYRGRTLFICLPLLKMLSRSEVTAILLHELAHFKGGDASSSAKLELALRKLSAYCKTNPWFTPLRLYLSAFEMARRGDGREREFLADRAAAEQGLARELSQSLIKHIHYTNFRNWTERKFFAHNRVYQGSIGMAMAIESGIANCDQTGELNASLLAAAPPHPFDTHPPLKDRLARLKFDVALIDAAMIAQAPRQDSWYAELADAESMEQALWTNYENRFKLNHEQDLAYRYVPADAEQQALVMKYFPVIAVSLKKGQTLHIRYDGLFFPETQLFIHWDMLNKYLVKQNKLIVHYRNPGAANVKKVFKFKKINQKQMHALLQKYWNRHAVMRKRNVAGVYATGS